MHPVTAPLNPTDRALLRMALASAERAKAAGRHPFGAIVADEHGNVVAEAGNNSMPPEGDPTQHAERAGRGAGGAAAAARGACPLHALHQRRTLCDVRRRHLLVQHRPRGVCDVGGKAAGIDRQPSGQPDAVAALPPGVRQRPAPDRGAWGRCRRWNRKRPRPILASGGNEMSAIDPVLWNDWHPVAASAGLEAGAMQPARLLERRSWSGAALTARCMPGMTAARIAARGCRWGRVAGDRLVCGYHGWQFDSAGACRLQPAHP